MINKLFAFLIALNVGCLIFNIAMSNWDTVVINIVAVFTLWLCEDLYN